MVNIRNDRGVVSGKESWDTIAYFGHEALGQVTNTRRRFVKKYQGCTETNLGECYIFQYWVLSFYRMFWGVQAGVMGL